LLGWLRKTHTLTWLNFQVSCKCYVGLSELDMDVIGLRVFPLLLTGDATVLFSELPYNRSTHGTNCIRCS